MHVRTNRPPSFSPNGGSLAVVASKAPHLSTASTVKRGRHARTASRLTPATATSSLLTPPTAAQPMFHANSATPIVAVTSEHSSLPRFPTPRRPCDHIRAYYTDDEETLLCQLRAIASVHLPFAPSAALPLRRRLSTDSLRSTTALIRTFDARPRSLQSRRREHPLRRSAPLARLHWLPRTTPPSPTSSLPKSAPSSRPS